MYDIGIAGHDLNDFNTWREWYLPNIDSEKDDYIYGISSDCSTECITNNAANDIGYYMTGNSHSHMRYVNMYIYFN